ncbi:uncharacterized protein Tco025E_07390 [Trypanosoma conorhini]|uniref:Flagellar attachment zone protein 1 conserved domain-containing protein n=1 Tax=Trypanosoma conorhini TaxID=83891 RepID=A0A3R7NJD2_9TRYP|nr:uncharacterized protein Tco025E_07390 [Trypanosoma conorhini]RNF07339.1 hypothetical protein Tco025E_07390 [Trypanosoma conorhini]
MIVEQDMGEKHHATATRNGEAPTNEHPAETHGHTKEGAPVVQQADTAVDDASAAPRPPSPCAQGTEAGAVDNGEALPAPRQTSENQLPKVQGGMEEVPDKSAHSAEGFSECGSDPPEAAAMVPLPTPQPPAQAVAVTTHKKTFAGSGWSSLLSSMRETVERTLLQETSKATGLPDASIRVVSMSVEADSTLLTELALVHDATASAAELDRALSLCAFEGMKELLETGASEEAPRPTEPGALPQGTATISHSNVAAVAAAAADDGDGDAAAAAEEAAAEPEPEPGQPRKRGVVKEKAPENAPRQKTVVAPQHSGKAAKRQKETPLRGDSPTGHRRAGGPRTEVNKNSVAPTGRAATPRKRIFTPRTELATPRAASTPRTGTTTPRMQRPGMRFLQLTSQFIATLSPTVTHLQSPVRPSGVHRASAAPEQYTPRRHLSRRESPLHVRSASHPKASGRHLRETKHAAQPGDVSGTKRYTSGIRRSETRPVPPQRIIRLGFPSFPRASHINVEPVSLLPAMQASEGADALVATDEALCAPLAGPLVDINDVGHDTHVADVAHSARSAEARSEKNHALLEKTPGVSRRSRSPAVPSVDLASSTHGHSQE